jgi:hypothetical protein
MATVNNPSVKLTSNAELVCLTFLQTDRMYMTWIPVRVPNFNHTVPFQSIQPTHDLPTFWKISENRKNREKIISEVRKKWV